MSDPFLEYTFRFGRGVNTMDAPATMEEGQGRVVRNLRLVGQGRVAPRKALKVADTLPANHEVCGIFPFPYQSGTAAAVLLWDSTPTTGERVRLYEMDPDGNLTVAGGGSGELAGHGVGTTTTRPRFVGAVLNQALFLADLDQANGLTVWDPVGNLGASEFFQPTFNFDPTTGADHAKATPYVLIEYENHLWMFGYLSEEDPGGDHIGRFSYLGLVDDGQGSGDAGTGGASGSTNLFDQEDFVPVMPKGETVTAASAATGRLLVLSNRRASVIYGSDRASWTKEILSEERGCVHPQAVCELLGVDYWMSPYGPCRYRGGGQIEILESRIESIVESIDMDSVRAVAVPDEYHARFYYRRTDDTTAGANRCLIWDARANQFVTDILGQRVFAVGQVHPSTLPGPAAAASALTHVNIQPFQAKATWTPGDTAPDVTQIVYRKEGVGGTYVEVARYNGAVAEHLHVGLDANTTYYTKIDTIRNGQSPSSGEPVEASFTTQIDTFVPPPVLTGYDNGYLDEEEVWRASVLLTWDYGSSNVTIQRKLTSEGAGSWADIIVLTGGEDNWEDRSVTAGTSYDYRAKNTDPVNGDSAWSNEVTVVPTDTGPGGPPE